MPFEALVRLVDSCPWFGAAQKVLCEKMSRLAGTELSRRQFADAALHVADRGKVTSLMRENVSCTDGDIAGLLKKYVENEAGGEEDGPAEAETAREVGTGGESPVESAAPNSSATNSTFRGVGDYFSREQYEQIRHGDNWVRGVDFTGDGAEKEYGESGGGAEMATEDFCTETIAKIYEEQGYFDKARQIYAKLILAYPEKNTYFAALIEKLQTR